MSTQDSSHSSIFSDHGDGLAPLGNAADAPGPPPLPDSFRPTIQRESEQRSKPPRANNVDPSSSLTVTILTDDDPFSVGGETDTPAPRLDLIDRLGGILFRAPAWMVSMVTHLVLFLIFALLAIHLPSNRVLQLNAVFSDRTGEQFEIEHFEAAAVSDALDEVFVAADELPPVDIPLAAPPQLTPAANAVHQQIDVATPLVGMALSGREEGQKKMLLEVYGGNAATENAVQLGLEWLAKNQRSSGNWSLKGPYKDGCDADNEVAATAMAMLAFQGAGHTHEKGTFKGELKKAKKWLLKQQENEDRFEGAFYKSRNKFFRGLDNHTFYTNGMATMAVCELYAMTGDETLKYPAQAAVNFLVGTQNPDGGWRYIANTESDTSVTGWIVMALQSARMGGLDVPEETFEKIGEFLDTVTSDYGSRYSYQTGLVDTLSMTAEGLLCRQYLGWPRDHQPLITGTGHLLDNPINHQDSNLYYWYYATQVLHHMEGDAWREWNSVMRDKLPAMQETKGRERGSWAPHDDRWADYAGRLFSTCFNVYMLEVYYRHLPLYSSLYGE